MTGLIKGGFVWVGAIALVLLSSTATFAETSFPSAMSADGSPDRRRGAGARCPHECINTDEETLFALVPQGNQSLTMQSQPDFFFYMPRMSGDVRLQFQLQQAHETIYDLSIAPIFPESGVKILSLADLPNVPHLQAGERYTWSVTLDCLPDGESKMHLRFVSELRVVEPDQQLLEQLTNVDELQQAEIYAKNGLWPDSLVALQQVKQQPQDFEQYQESVLAWDELLSSVGLEYFASKPLLSQ